MSVRQTHVKMRTCGFVRQRRVSGSTILKLTGQGTGTRTIAKYHYMYLGMILQQRVLLVSLPTNQLIAGLLVDERSRPVVDKGGGRVRDLTQLERARGYCEVATAANGKFAEACDAIIKALSTIEPADSGYTCMRSLEYSSMMLEFPSMFRTVQRPPKQFALDYPVEKSPTKDLITILAIPGRHASKSENHVTQRGARAVS